MLRQEIESLKGVVDSDTSGKGLSRERGVILSRNDSVITLVIMVGGSTRGCGYPRVPVTRCN